MLRSKAKREIRARGGIPSKSVVKDLNYLVVGAKGSPNWCHSNYGRKISKAKSFIENDSGLQMVSESDFIFSLYSTAPIENEKQVKINKYLLLRLKITYNRSLILKELESNLNILEKKDYYISNDFSTPKIIKSLFSTRRRADRIIELRFIKPLHINDEKLQLYVDDVCVLIKSIKGIIENKVSWSEQKMGSGIFLRLFKEIKSNTKISTINLKKYT